MEWERAIDFLGWTAILLWVGLSGYFFSRGDAAAFQSVGVIGIAAGVGYFVAQRHAAPYPFGSLEMFHALGKRASQNTQAILIAQGDIAILAKLLVRDAERRGEELPARICALANVPEESVRAAFTFPHARFVEESEEVLKQQLDAEDIVKRARRNSELLQAAVVVLGTLQSGLGGPLISLIESGVD